MPTFLRAGAHARERAHIACGATFIAMLPNWADEHCRLHLDSFARRSLKQGLHCADPLHDDTQYVPL